MGGIQKPPPSQAMADAELKERYFITPLALSSAANRPASSLDKTAIQNEEKRFPGGHPGEQGKEGGKGGRAKG
jgi:hypothetical protein